MSNLMFDRSCTVKFPDREVKLSPGQLNQFILLFFPAGEIQKRISKLFVIDLYMNTTFGGLAPRAVLGEIDVLEGRTHRSRGTKPASPFSRSKQLTGLWHKHFFCAPFLARNIQTGLAGGRLSELVQAAMMDLRRSTGGGDITEEIAHRVSSELANRATRETLDIRAASNGLTGEWIVFAQHEGKNYYLCIDRHQSGDGVIRKRIDRHCVPEFPFLTKVLSKPDHTAPLA